MHACSPRALQMAARCASLQPQSYVGAGRRSFGRQQFPVVRTAPRRATTLSMLISHHNTGISELICGTIDQSTLAAVNKTETQCGSRKLRVNTSGVEGALAGVEVFLGGALSAGHSSTLHTTAPESRPEGRGPKFKSQLQCCDH